MTRKRRYESPTSHGSVGADLACFVFTLLSLLGGTACAPSGASDAELQRKEGESTPWVAPERPLVLAGGGGDVWTAYREWIRQSSTLHRYATSSSTRSKPCASSSFELLVVSALGENLNSDLAKEASGRGLANAFSVENRRLRLSDGTLQTRYIDLRYPEHAKEDEVVALFRNADAAFFRGGDQTRYRQYLVGSEAEAALLGSPGDARAPLKALGGTSAGAHIMSEWTIAPELGASADAWYLVNDAYYEGVVLAPQATAQNSYFQLPFMPVLPCTILTTHFTQRGRILRLLPLMARLWQRGNIARYNGDTCSDLLGIGVDPETAVVSVLDKERAFAKRLSVWGAGTAYFFAPTSETQAYAKRGEPAFFTELHVVAATSDYDVDLDPTLTTHRAPSHSGAQSLDAPDTYPPLPSDLGQRIDGTSLQESNLGSAYWSGYQRPDLLSEHTLVEGGLFYQTNESAALPGFAVFPNVFATAFMPEALDPETGDRWEKSYLEAVFASIPFVLFESNRHYQNQALDDPRRARIALVLPARTLIGFRPSKESAEAICLQAFSADSPEALASSSKRDNRSFLVADFVGSSLFEASRKSDYRPRQSYGFSGARVHLLRPGAAWCWKPKSKLHDPAQRRGNAWVEVDLPP